jgi:hypothetical protein
MAIVRYKNNNFGFDKNVGTALIKSGSVSRVIANTLRDKDTYHSFFYNEDAYSKNGHLLADKLAELFNDDNTIIFDTKQIVPTYGLETKYFDNTIETLENNIQHTPNTFYGINVGTKDVNVKREKYNKLLEPNYLKSSSAESISFEENENITGNEVKNILNFNFNLHKPCILSFNKNQNIADTISFTNDDSSIETFNRHNGNMAYFYGKNDGQIRGQGFGSFDFIGNIAKNYHENIAEISAAPIGFMPPTSGSVENDGILSTTSIPVDTFNFPFDVKFKAEDRHCFDVSKYIAKPFVIEKIYIETTISNYSQTTTSSSSCLNYLNFFVLNQTGKLLHTDIVGSNDIEYSLDNSSIETFSNPPVYNDSPIYSSAEAPIDLNAILDDDTSLSNSMFTIDKANNNDVYESEKNNDVSIREIITYGTVSNFSINSQDSNQYTDIVASLNSYSDVLNFSSNSSVNNVNNYVENIFKNEKILLEITPRIINKNDSLPHIGNFNIFPRKKSSSANGLELKSNRFIHNDKNINSQNLLGSNITRVGKQVDINENAFRESKYIILPGDKIVLGVSFSPNLSINSDGTGESVLKIHDEIRMSFSGYYLENDQKKYYKTQQYNFKNSKKFGFVHNKVCDDPGKPEKVLQVGLYNNNQSVALAGQVITRINSFAQSFKNSYLSLPNKNVYDENISSDYKILNKVSGETITNSDKDYFKHYFNVSRYGQSADFTKYSINTKNYDSNLNKIINCVTKKFKKGFFIDKNPCKSEGSLNFDFASIENYNNISSNWLKDNMFFKFTPTVTFPVYTIPPGFGVPILSGWRRYAQNAIDVMMFDIEDNIGNKVHFLVRLVQHENIHSSELDSNYFIASGGFLESYSSIAKHSKNYENTDEDFTFAIVSIPDDITNSFNTNENGRFIDIPKIDEFVIKIAEGINDAYNSSYISYDLDVTNTINSGVSFTRLILESEFEGFYNDQSIGLEDIESNSITFRFKDQINVYTVDDDLTYLDDDPDTNVVFVGIKNSSTNQKDSKSNQILSLLNAINKSAVNLRATQSYDSELELFISQTESGSSGNTNVINHYNNQLSFDLSNFDKGSSLKSRVFDLHVDASLKEVEDINIRTVLIKNLTRGKTGNSNINSGTSSNIIKENFSVIEGDIINSYNMDENASFVDDELVFKER